MSSFKASKQIQVSNKRKRTKRSIIDFRIPTARKGKGRKSFLGLGKIKVKSFGLF